MLKEIIMINKLNCVIVLFFLISLTNACQKGCILCKNDECLICDKQNWYFKVGTICTLKKLDNCLSSDNGEECLRCEPNYYVIYATKKCSKVSVELIENCRYYEDEGVCSICEPGFYLLNNKCTISNVTIASCAIYSSDGICQECEEGKVLSVSNDACIEIPYENCMSLGTIKCRECEQNYVQYENSYLYYFNVLTKEKLKKVDIYDLSGEYFTTCVPLIVTNCKVYEEFYKCRECDDGYFLNPSFTCSLLPEEPIQNCFEYKTKGVCIECLEGYYLQSESECSPHTRVINFCEKMSLDEEDVCIKCDDSFFLDANTCLERNLADPNCKTLSIDSDTCDECESIYSKNETGTKCLLKFEFCHTHSVTIDTIKCAKCNPGFYWIVAESRCAKVGDLIDGCYFYETLPGGQVDSDGRAYKCIECAVGYYMNNNVCEKHTSYVLTDYSCKLWSNTVKDICEECEADENLYSVLNYCPAVALADLDQNCGLYAHNSELDKAVCTECNPGYYLVQDQYCIKIAIVFCQKVLTASRCLECASSELENYFPSKDANDNKCILSYDFVTGNCESSTEFKTEVAVNYNICSSCYSPYYPDEIESAAFCVPRSKIIKNYDNDNNQTAFLANKNIEYCKVYIPESDKCLICEFDTVTNSQRVLMNGRCKNTCDNGYAVDIIVSDQFFVCVVNATGNCKIKNGNNCLKCDSGYIPEFKPDFSFDNTITYDYIPAFETGHFKAKSISYDNPFNKVTVFEACKQFVASDGTEHDVVTTNATGNYPVYIFQADYSTKSDLWTFCGGVNTIIINGFSTYGCSVCKFGFSGYYVLSTNGTDQMIAKCELNSVCDYGIYFNGIGGNLAKAELSAWCTCHKCIDENNENLIPTFSRFKRAGLVTSGLPGAATGNFFKQTDCKKPGILDNNTQFPTACGIQEYVPDSAIVLFNPASVDPIPNPRCHDCKPGYKATVTNTVVTACTLIAHCDQNAGLTTFNKCLKCITGYAVNAAMDLCVANTVENCYEAFSEDAADKGKCKVCMEGYAVTRDNLYCNKIKLDNCLDADRFKLAATISDPYIGDGCRECDLGYVATKFLVKQKVCIKSFQIENRDFTNIGVSDCNIYLSHSTCKECNVGFVLPQGINNRCILSSKITNCKSYNAAEECIECQERYILLNKQCDNGEKYITNCLTFTSKTVCSACAEFYVPITVNTTTKCNYVGKSINNCKVYNTVKSLSAVIECTTCANNYFPKPLGVSGIKTCANIPQIKNCKTYNDSGTCTECFDDYYLSIPIEEGELEFCLKRTDYPYLACKEMELTSDACKYCINGYYVRNKRCSFKPTGVIGCAVYQDNKTCLKCSGDQFLLGNICRKVPEEFLVDKCLYYQNESTCSDCKAGYLLVDNTCKAILISDCDIYENEKECQVCKEQYFITEQKTCKKGNIANCSFYSSLKQCALCNNNYYVNEESICQAVEQVNKIDNCKYYSSGTTCQTCTNGTLLAEDGSKCINFSSFPSNDVRLTMQQANCDNYVYESFCKVCSPGYRFVGGICTPCSENVKNCFYCDYKDETLCHICKPKSYQTKEGDCVPFIDSGVEGDGSGGDNNNSGGDGNNGSNPDGSGGDVASIMISQSLSFTMVLLIISCLFSI